MDFLSKVGVVIDTKTNNIFFDKQRPPSPKKFKIPLSKDKPITLASYSKNAIMLPCQEIFSIGLIESTQNLPDQVMVMDGISSSTSNSCLAVLLPAS